MNTDYYYKAPDDEIFEEVKEKALEIWREYDNPTVGIKDKIKRIEDMDNIRDNLMVIVAMFDVFNQRDLSSRISDEANKEIRERLIAGGSSLHLINF